MTEPLFFSVLKEAFSALAIAFDNAWLQNITFPDREKSEGFEYLISVLEFRIAELYLMRDKQLKDDSRIFGIDSETGCRWYNFDPHANLECGARGMGFTFHGDDDAANNPDAYTWELIGELLETGRIYE